MATFLTDDSLWTILNDLNKRAITTEEAFREIKNAKMDDNHYRNYTIGQLADTLQEYALEQKQNDKMTLKPFEIRWTCPLCLEVIIQRVGNMPPKYCCNVSPCDTFSPDAEKQDTQ